VSVNDDGALNTPWGELQLTTALADDPALTISEDDEAGYETPTVQEGGGAMVK